MVSDARTVAPRARLLPSLRTSSSASAKQKSPPRSKSSRLVTRTACTLASSTGKRSGALAAERGPGARCQLPAMRHGASSAERTSTSSSSGRPKPAPACPRKTSLAGWRRMASAGPTSSSSTITQRSSSGRAAIPLCQPIEPERSGSGSAASSRSRSTSRPRAPGASSSSCVSSASRSARRCSSSCTARCSARLLAAVAGSASKATSARSTPANTACRSKYSSWETGSNLWS